MQGSRAAEGLYGDETAPGHREASVFGRVISAPRNLHDDFPYHPLSDHGGKSFLGVLEAESPADHRAQAGDMDGLAHVLEVVAVA